MGLALPTWGRILAMTTVASLFGASGQDFTDDLEVNQPLEECHLLLS